MKVRNRLEQSNPVAFKEFIITLGQFQSSSGAYLELYKKIESLLKDNMDLLEEFVLFLSPEVATQCGVQFQHFLYVRMREFFSKLKVMYFINIDLSVSDRFISFSKADSLQR